MASSEQATLGHIYNFLTNKPDELQKAARFGRFMQVWGYGLIIAASLIAEFTPVPKFICVLVGAVGGVMLTFPWYIRLVHNSLAHLTPYINEHNIKSRLDLIKYSDAP